MKNQLTIKEDVSVANDGDNFYELIEGDELNELKLLRLVSSYTYVFACYKHVAEISTAASENKYGYICECNQPPSTQNSHYCPANAKFVPTLQCQLHPQCNDPINVCFEIQMKALNLRKKTPELGEEYKAVSYTHLTLPPNREV